MACNKRGKTMTFRSYSFHRLAFILACIPLFPPLVDQSNAHNTWRAYGGAEDGAQYSSLKQINRSNVATLKPMDLFNGRCGCLFLQSFSHSRYCVCLSGEGSHRRLGCRNGQAEVARSSCEDAAAYQSGLSYWQSRNGSDARLIFAADNSLREIDARTGKSIQSFGNGGLVDLREGLEREPEALTLVQSYNPGRVFENLVILGSATNEEYRSGPGDIRAFDIVTGRLAWTFHTGPHPGETGYETWPKDAWKTAGGANARSSMSLDDKRGILYVPTASPKYTFYSGNRTGKNLFGDSLLALDARTASFGGTTKWCITTYGTTTIPALHC
jgi:quinoprotein glucose dehydrogenase